MSSNTPACRYFRCPSICPFGHLDECRLRSPEDILAELRAELDRLPVSATGFRGPRLVAQCIMEARFIRCYLQTYCPERRVDLWYRGGYWTAVYEADR